MGLQSLDSKDETNFFPVPLENGVVCCNFAHIKELLVFKRDLFFRTIPFSLLNIGIYI